LAPELETLCLTAMEKATARRQASMTILAADLAGYLEGTPDPEPQSPTRDRSPTETIDARIACPSCGRQLRFPPSLLGSQVRCPRCRQRFRLPSTPSDMPTDSPPGGVNLLPPAPVPAAAPLTKEFANSLGMKFVLIPAGTFLMGSPE